MDCLIHQVPYVEKRQPAAGVELLRGLDEADVSFRDEVGEGQPALRVHFGDRDDQAQIGPNQVLARLLVPLLNTGTKLLFLVRGEKRDFVDFLEISLEAAFSRNSRPPCHIEGGWEAPVRRSSWVIGDQLSG